MQLRLLKLNRAHPGPEQLFTQRLMLRRPEAADFDEWSALRARSAAFLKPFEPSWAQDELSRSAYRLRMRRQEAEITAGRGIPWFLFDLANNVLVGGITLSNIRRGVSQTATLGYWMGESYAGRGLMREAVIAVCGSAFERHGLHRLEAATVLENERSQRLLRRCGFRDEGHARGYLKIAGTWRDHLLFARLASDKPPEICNKPASG
ncbi:MAG: GNAT family protein [Ahrensia sp.]|nr:GNAT family protein [Ahrensia sp.]